MTLNEFGRQVRQIEKEELESGSLDTVSFGLERSKFEIEKLKRLIALGKRVGLKTSAKRISKWQKQLEKVQENQRRFEAIKKKHGL